MRTTLAFWKKASVYQCRVDTRATAAAVSGWVYIYINYIYINYIYINYIYKGDRRGCVWLCEAGEGRTCLRARASCAGRSDTRIPCLCAHACACVRAL